MFGEPIRTGLTLTKVISGLTKTLSVANRVIPLYKEAKPMIMNAKTILNTLKEMNKKEDFKQSVKPTVKASINEKKTIYTNSPTFFL